MNLKEAKEIIAQKYLYENWDALIEAKRKERGSHYWVELWTSEAAEIYAKSKWEEACKKQKIECERAANFGESDELEVLILNAMSVKFDPNI